MYSHIYLECGMWQPLKSPDYSNLYFDHDIKRQHVHLPFSKVAYFPITDLSIYFLILIFWVTSIEILKVDLTFTIKLLCFWLVKSQWPLDFIRKLGYYYNTLCILNFQSCVYTGLREKGIIFLYLPPVLGQ